MNLIEISFTVGTKKKYYLVLLINFSNCMCNVRLVIPSDKMYFIFLFEHVTSISFEYSLDFCLYCNRFFLNNEVMPNGLNNDNYRLSLES